MSGSDKSTEQPIINFKETFTAIDKDGDGKVSRDDMVAFLTSLEQHRSEQDLDRMNPRGRQRWRRDDRLFGVPLAHGCTSCVLAISWAMSGRSSKCSTPTAMASSALPSCGA